MKNLFIKLLKFKIEYLARLTIKRYKPKIVGITGSVGKTSTKFMLKSILEAKYKVRASYGNLNNELGLSLGILGDWKESDLSLVSHNQPVGTEKIKKILFWANVIFSSWWRIIKKVDDYPQILILEYGVDRPGDMKKLLKIAKPDVSIITAIGEIPVHIEFFQGQEELAREKGRLIECLLSAQFAVLNADDETVMRLRNRTRASILTYGFSKEANIRITRFENTVENNLPVGISFKLEYLKSFVPVRIKSAFGKSQAMATAAAASVAILFGMNLVEISEAVSNYIPAPSRMNLIKGVKDTLIIDDSYNASPLSMYSALETLENLPAKRKVAVLGDMLEIGKYTIEAHENVGTMAGKFLDLLVTVGERAKFIAESARVAGMKKNNIFSFDTASDAKGFVQNIIKTGDLILIKGSHSMNLSEVVEEIKYIDIS
jgi:UDP-N-acetylmuramoyl-tripeptide--D-alanyl-D-alanine ligase